MNDRDEAGGNTVTAPPDETGGARSIDPVFTRPAESFERYRVLGEHGRGGIGRVVRAHDRAMGRVVAIKELHRRDRVAEARFLREAFLTARLEHPAIVAVHEAGQWPDGTPFYSMKLVAGRPLRELIEDAGTLEQRLALLPHVIAVADAIAYAHSQRVLHRDLKPANVIVGDFGETVVIDWGLAKDLSSGDDALAPAPAVVGDDLTEIGSVVGTPAYMAPEQARGEPSDERSDVYALGAILYAVVAGHAPYSGHSPPDLIRAVIAGPPRPLASLAPEAPSDLVAIAEAAMDRVRARRLPSALAVADELRRFQRGQLVRSRRYTTGERALRWMRRRRELTAALFASALVIASIGAIAVSRIVGERDLAEKHQHRAEAALVDASAQRDQLILSHARAATISDPTEAVVALRAYRGPDTRIAQELAAIATAGRVATFTRTDVAARSGRAASFDPAHVFVLGADRVLRSWRAGVPAPAVLAVDVAEDLDLQQSSSTGEIAFVASGTLRRLDPVTGAVVAVETLAAPPVSVGFSPDGAWLFAATRDGAIALHHRDQPAIRLRLPGAGVTVAAVAAGATAIAACDLNRQLWSWHRAHGWRAVPVRCATGLDKRFAFAPDGTMLALATLTGIALVDVATGEARQLPVATGVTSVLRFADRAALLAADREGGLVEVSVKDLTQRRLFAAGASLLSMAVHGDTVVAGAADGALIRVSRADGRSERIPGTGVGDDLQLSPDGRFLLAIGGQHIRVLPIADNRAWRTDGTVSLAAYSVDGRWLAAASDAGDVLLVDRTCREQGPRHLRGHTDTVSGVAFAGTRLVTASLDRTLRTWETVGGRWTSRTVFRATGRIIRLALAPGEDRAFVIEYGGTIARIELATGASVVVHRSPHAPISLAVAPDESALALLSSDGHLEVVDLATGRARTMLAEPGGADHVAFDRSGALLATVGVDGAHIRSRGGALLRAVPPRPGCDSAGMSRDHLASICDGVVLVEPFTATAGPVRRYVLAADPGAVGFSSDGRWLAIATNGGPLYVVDTATGSLAVRRTRPSLVARIQFAPDDREIAVTSLSSVLETFDTTTLELVPGEPDALARWLNDRVDTAESVTTPSRSQR